MYSRRNVLLAGLGAPAMLGAAATEDVAGKLTRDELPTPALLLDLDAF
ncbi:MAG: hypothetical protein GY953_14050, partial [bacterium]|nr:hypothetical protein [bacterium]